MKKIMLASAAVLALSAGAAMSADLGKGFSWNNEWTNTYNVTDDVFTSGLESEVSYAVTSEVRAYGTFYVDVKETEFLGSEFGVEYSPSQFKYLSTSAYVTLDDKFENEKFFVEAVLNF